MYSVIHAECSRHGCTQIELMVTLPRRGSVLGLRIEELRSRIIIIATDCSKVSQEKADTTAMAATGIGCLANMRLISHLHRYGKTHDRPKIIINTLFFFQIQSTLLKCTGHILQHVAANTNDSPATAAKALYQQAI